VATVAVDGMVFHSPVLVGDEVSIYGEITRIGRSSMRIEIEAWRRERASDSANLVTEAVFTFVAIDAARRPRPVPPEPGA
jgi:acyl-CoA thioesterase YciA